MAAHIQPYFIRGPNDLYVGYDVWNGSFDEANQFTNSVLLAVDEDLVIGYFAMEITEPSKMKLHKIYLDPDQKSKGVGSQIIAFIKEFGFKAGVKHIELNVNKFNSAVQFYEKMGFFRAKEMVLDIGNGYVMDDYVMQLNLESAQ